MAVSNSLREVTDDATKQLRSKEQTETAEYILLYGKYETVISDLGPQVEKLLKSAEFPLSDNSGPKSSSAITQQWPEFYKQVVDTYIKSREPVGPLVLKSLRKFAASDPKPETDFKSFARRCIQYVFDICYNELTLVEKFFQDGPNWNKDAELAEKIEENRFSHLATLFTFLTPYLSNGDLTRICGLTSWLEANYLTSNEDFDSDRTREAQKLTAHVLLDKHLWPLSDALFLKAAAEIEHFKPSPENLKINIQPAASPASENEAVPKSEPLDTDAHRDAHTRASPGMSSAYPTVKTAVKLLVMYNDRVYDRPVSKPSYLVPAPIFILFPENG